MRRETKSLTDAKLFRDGRGRSVLTRTAATEWSSHSYWLDRQRMLGVDWLVYCFELYLFCSVCGYCALEYDVHDYVLVRR